LDNYYEFIDSVYEAEKRIAELDTEIKKIELGQRYIVIFNRRLANFLGSVRMYIDQSQHDLSSLNMTECSKEDFHRLTNEQYDKYIGYQIMELLRNYLQHEGIIIEGITYLTPLFTKEMEYHNLLINIEYKSLKAMGRYKSKIKLDEQLAALGAKGFNLIWFIDEYIRGLITVHSNFLNLVSEKTKSSKKMIDNILLKCYANCIPEEVGVFGEEQDFLLHYNYVKNFKQYIPVLKECSKEKMYFRSTDCIQGNLERIEIRYKL
jgi:hypothetical protein